MALTEEIATIEKPPAELAWAAAAARNLRLDAPRRSKGRWVAVASATPAQGEPVAYEGTGEDADAAYLDLIEKLPPLRTVERHCPTCTCEV